MGVRLGGEWGGGGGGDEEKKKLNEPGSQKL